MATTAELASLGPEVRTAAGDLAYWLERAARAAARAPSTPEASDAANAAATAAHRMWAALRRVALGRDRPRPLTLQVVPRRPGVVATRSPARR